MRELLVIHPAVWAVVVTMAVIPALIRRWDVGQALDWAIAASGLNRATVASALGLSEAQLSRGIHGAGPEHLSSDRLTNLPRPVDVLFWLAWGVHIGVGDDAETRALKEATRLHQQVRASLRHDNAGVRECSSACEMGGDSWAASGRR